MFMRHYGNGVGHLQYEQQPEIEPDNGMAVEEDPTEIAGELDSVVHESVEEEDEGGDGSESDIISDSKAKSDCSNGSSCGGYASY